MPLFSYTPTSTCTCMHTSSRHVLQCFMHCDMYASAWSLASLLSCLYPACLPSKGRCVLVFEIGRPTLDCTNADLTALAKRYVSAGADALAVRVDADTTPEGLKDLFAVVQAVRVPVLARDWYLHPLQVCCFALAPAVAVELTAACHCRP